jgi:hypothetical protein
MATAETAGSDGDRRWWNVAMGDVSDAEEETGWKERNPVKALYCHS